MINFFRKIRQHLLSENKFSKYLPYAIGEIILVVIGILIALQINNWNEVRKQNRQLEIYEKSLVSELKSDLKSLENLDFESTSYIKSINNYVSYYNKPNKDINVLTRKMDSIVSFKNSFNSIAYTIDDIISTGNLSLFSQEKKEAILRLKRIQEQSKYYRQKSEEDLIIKERSFDDTVDLLFIKKNAITEHKNVEKWNYNLNSEQYRLFNNKMAIALDVHRYHIEVNQRIREATENLLKVITKDY